MCESLTELHVLSRNLLYAASDSLQNPSDSEGCEHSSLVHDRVAMLRTLTDSPQGRGENRLGSDSPTSPATQHIVIFFFRHDQCRL